MCKFRLTRFSGLTRQTQIIAAIDQVACDKRLP
jgi:hypothetical protein